jgi:hypothetical protein
MRGKERSDPPVGSSIKSDKRKGGDIMEINPVGNPRARIKILVGGVFLFSALAASGRKCVMLAFCLG